MEGLTEAAEAEAFFLSYARLADGRMLVAGQDGLGADCSGDAWIELRDDGSVAWRQDKQARVFDHAAGPFVQMGRALWRLDDEGTLQAYGSIPEDTWILAWTTEGDPVLRDGSVLRFGDRTLELPSGDEPDVTDHAGQLGVVEAIWSQQAEANTKVTLHIVDGDQVRNVTWDLPGGWGSGIAWADGWLVAAGGRAFLVTDKVTDLGVADARAVSHRGDQGVVFTERGYVVFDGTEPVEAWERSQPPGQPGVWRPVALDVEGAREVPAESEGPGFWVGSGSPTPRAKQEDEGAFTIPALMPAALAIALLATALRLRR